MKAIPLICLGILAGCDDSASPTGTVVVPAPSPTLASRSAPLAVVPTPSATRAPNGDRIARVSETPVMTSRPPQPMRSTKNFTDPPLPRELRDDGGLLPLPATSAESEAEEDKT